NIQKTVLELSTMTQEVWENQMLVAGASYDEIEGMVTDATGKITEEHLKMYLEIQAAAGGYTDKERENVKKAMVEYKKLTNTKYAELQKRLAAVREMYSEQDKIISAAYDEEILRLKLQPDLIDSAYEEVLSVVRAKTEKRKEILEASYQAEADIIKGMDLSRKEEQEAMNELNKKTENRRIARAKEVAKVLRDLAEDALTNLSDIYEKEAKNYDESIDKRIDSINRFYENERIKVELQGERDKAALSKKEQYGDRWVAIEASASLRAFGIENEWIIKRKTAANALYNFKKDLLEKLVDLEFQRADKLVTLEEEAKNRRLVAAEAYHEKQIELIRISREQAVLVHGEGSDELIEAEENLNDKLIEINRTSVETRIDLLRGWANYLESQYDGAINKAREYSNKVIGFENELVDIRKKAAKALISATATTEDRLLEIRRAGMTKQQVAWSRVQEAYRKMTEANRLALEIGTADALAEAKKLYGEAQSIYTELGVQSIGAAKEGKKLGVSYKAAFSAVKEAGEGIKNVLKAEEELSIKAKQAELDVAKQAQNSWADLARDIKEEVGSIQVEIEDLTGLVGSMVSSIDSIEDKEVDIGADEAKLNTSIELVDGLWKSIDRLENKEVTITTKYVEERKAGGFIGRKFDRGGSVPGSGSEDTVPAKLTPGEYVIPKDRVSQYGLHFMESIRSGMLDVGNFLRFGLGGLVRKAEPAVNTLFPSAAMTDLVPALTKVADRLSRVSTAASSEGSGAKVGGKYDFTLNLGGAKLEGTAPKSVLEQFKVDLRRLNLAGGLA
ncbi:MAG: hypothetical protein U9R60_17890, partial [Bacteroidota bacterium]|nr:hypothetical protein [Bacteroidota bacterium]